MTVSGAIEIIGNELFDGFSIKDEPLRGAYKLAYDTIISDCNKNGKSKGLLIIGSIGCGKTAMMKVYQKLFLGQLRGFKMTNGGILKDMLDELSVSEIKSRYGYDCKMDLYIDDIGVNFNTANKYGNKVNIISEVLMERYDLFISEGWKTHLSTNLVPKLEDNPNNIPTLSSIYGGRVYDRIKEMCQLITINSPSLRK
jgi:DNA replication protein DnaC